MKSPDNRRGCILISILVLFLAMSLAQIVRTNVFADDSNIRATAPTPGRTTALKPKVEKASYYGKSLRGRHTASGQRYNPQALTAASKNIPIGTKAKVTNLHTGQTVNVTINDRGPVKRGRSLDLSRGAAQKIGLTHEGVAAVRVTPVSAGTHTGTVPPTEHGLSERAPINTGEASY